MHVDISGLKEAEREISRLTDEYEKVFNGTQDAMFLIQVLEDGSFRYVRNNFSHQNKTKISLEQIVNQSPQTLLGEDVGNVVAENYRKCVHGRTSITYEEELDLPGGSFVWQTTLTPIFDGDVITHIVGSAEDITVRKKLELELEAYANYDKLTGLPNRRLFFERLEQIIQECKRDKKSFALLFLDLDGFKAINDEYGHEIGDEVLIAVGKRLAKSIRASDMVARMGGDEFTAMIRNSVDRAAVEVVAGKVHKSISKAIRVGEMSHAVNASIGIAIYPENGKDSKTLLRNADAAMYAVKRAGKGGYG
jgi:histidinol-phosphatase (PHP family)